MAKCEFNKDALQHLCGAASRTAVFRDNWLDCFVFCTYFKVVRYSFVSLTTDTLIKAIKEPSSVHFFSNIVSVTGGGVWGIGVHSSWYFKFLRWCSKVID